MKDIRAAVIGVGQLGEQHTRVYWQLPGVKLVGVYDLNRAKAERVASNFGTQVFGDYGQLLRQVDVASIAVPTISHYGTAKRALDEGVHVLVEKPLARAVEEAEELVDMAKRKGLVLQVGHIERFNAAIRALERVNVAPRFIESHRLALFDPRGTDVAVVLDLMIHDIDIILSFVRSRVAELDAVGVPVVSDQEDIANARLRFENGCVANVTASRISQKRMRKMRIFQENTYISIDFLQAHTEIYRLQSVADGDREEDNTTMIIFGETGAIPRRKRIVYERLTTTEEEPLKLELESFIDSVRWTNEPKVTGEEGKEALRVAVEVLDKIKENSHRLTGNRLPDQF